MFCVYVRVDHDPDKSRWNKILLYIRCLVPLNIVEKCVWPAFYKEQWAWSDTTQSTTGGCPKLIFVCISRNFRSKYNFNLFAQNGRRQPFWMSEIHFCLHLSPFSFVFHLKKKECTHDGVVETGMCHKAWREPRSAHDLDHLDIKCQFLSKLFYIAQYGNNNIVMLLLM